MPDVRHLRGFRVPSSVLAALIVSGKQFRFLNVPNDADLAWSWFDNMRQELTMIFQHPSFTAFRDGEIVESYPLEIQTLG